MYLHGHPRRIYSDTMLNSQAPLHFAARQYHLLLYFSDVYQKMHFLFYDSLHRKAWNLWIRLDQRKVFFQAQFLPVSSGYQGQRAWYGRNEFLAEYRVLTYTHQVPFYTI